MPGIWIKGKTKQSKDFGTSRMNSFLKSGPLDKKCVNASDIMLRRII